jgi:phosphonate transport system substrate-binding protein
MHSTFRHRTISLFVLLLSIALLSSACTVFRENNAWDGNNLRVQKDTRQPQLERLNVAVIPHRASEDAEEKIARLADYLQATLGLPVNIQLTEDYDTSIDLLVAGKVEMAYLGPFSYVKAKQRNPNLEPIVAHIEKNTGRPWYTSTIIVNIDSGIERIEDLKWKRFGFVSQSSTSGYLFPSAQLKQSGLNPEQDFIEIKYSGSHNNNAAALAAGEVDAIAIDKSTYLLAKESGTLPESQYRMIWESTPIPNSPIVISSQLPESFKLELKKALINAPTGLVAIGGSNADGYTLVRDKDYEPIRQVQTLLNLN